MSVPGFKKEDIKISFKDGYLKVEGKAAEEKDLLFELFLYQ